MKASLIFLSFTLFSLVWGQLNYGNLNLTTTCGTFDAAIDATYPIEATFLNGSFYFYNYDVVIWGNFSVDTGDTEGRVFAGLAEIGSGYSIGAGLNYSNGDIELPYGLVSLGQATWLSGELFPLNVEAILSGDQPLTANSAQNLQNRILYDQFDNVIQEDLGALSNELGNYLGYYASVGSSIGYNILNSFSNVEYTLQWEGIFLQCGYLDVIPTAYYLALPVSDFNQINWYSANWVNTLTLNLPGDCNTYLPFFIYVYGNGTETAVFKGDNIQSAGGNVVYFFDNVPVVNITTKVVGSIWAPNSDINQVAGNVVGRVLGASYTAVEASQVSRPCTEIFEITLTTVTAFPPGPYQLEKRSDASQVEVVGFGGFSAGDQVSVGGESATIANLVDDNGSKYIQFTSALTQSHPAGTLITGTVSVSSLKGSSPIISNSNSASTLGMSLIVLVSLIISLLF